MSLLSESRSCGPSLRHVGQDGRPLSMAGESSDVLRRQKDGRWLIAVDNPWGTRILPK